MKQMANTQLSILTKKNNKKIKKEKEKNNR